MLFRSNYRIWRIRFLIRRQSQTGYFYWKGGSSNDLQIAWFAQKNTRFLFFQPRTVLTKVDDGFPPLYYYGSPSARLEERLRWMNAMKSFKRGPPLSSRALKHRHSRLLKPSRLDQNRMDRHIAGLVTHNATLNRVVPYNEVAKLRKDPQSFAAALEARVS